MSRSKSKRKKNQAPNYRRLVHVFLDNLCIAEISFTGYLYDFKSRAVNVSFHVTDSPELDGGFKP